MKKFKFIIAPILSIALLASCGGGTEYKVHFPEGTNGLIPPSNLTVKKGSDYVADFSVSQTIAPGITLPTTLDRVTSGNAELFVGDGYTYTLSEENTKGHIVIPSKNITGDIDIKFNLVSPDINKVTAEEFAAAIACTGIEYAQMKVKINMYGVDVISTAECSPTISHTIQDISSMEYEETYAKKIDGIVKEGLKRESESGAFTPIDADELPSAFHTPSELMTYAVDPTKVTFDKCTYNTVDHTYVCIYSPGEGAEDNVVATLKFENKKLISVDQKMQKTGALFSNATCTYNENTPVWPA